jgi:hypothetical protein
VIRYDLDEYLKVHEDQIIFDPVSSRYGEATIFRRVHVKIAEFLQDLWALSFYFALINSSRDTTDLFPNFDVDN